MVKSRLALGTSTSGEEEPDGMEKVDGDLRARGIC